MKRKIWISAMALLVIFSYRPNTAHAATRKQCPNGPTCNNTLDCPADCTQCNHQAEEGPQCV